MRVIPSFGSFGVKHHHVQVVLWAPFQPVVKALMEVLYPVVKVVP